MSANVLASVLDDSTRSILIEVPRPILINSQIHKNSDVDLGRNQDEDVWAGCYLVLALPRCFD